MGNLRIETQPIIADSRKDWRGVGLELVTIKIDEGTVSGVWNIQSLINVAYSLTSDILFSASAMSISFYLIRLFLCQLLLGGLSLADQIVFLDRPANPTIPLAEPFFNPKSVTAEIGEKIQFIARFGDQRSFQPLDVLLSA